MMVQTEYVHGDNFQEKTWRAAESGPNSMIHTRRTEGPLP